jgi:hypothetical protein
VLYDHRGSVKREGQQALHAVGGVNSMIPTGIEQKAFVRETDFLLQ